MIKPNSKEPVPAFELEIPEGFGDALRAELDKRRADPEIHTEKAYAEVLENLLGAALQAHEIAMRGSDGIRMYRQFRECQERASYMPDRIPAISMLLYTSFRCASMEVSALFSDSMDSEERTSVGEILLEAGAVSGVLAILSSVRDDEPLSRNAIRDTVKMKSDVLEKAVSRYNAELDPKEMLSPSNYAATCSVMEDMFSAASDAMSYLIRILSGQDVPEAGGYDAIMKPGVDAIVRGLESQGTPG